MTIGILAAIFAIVLLGLLIRFCVDDARRRGKSPFLVCLAAVFFFPWGLIAWLLFRPDPIELPPDEPFCLNNYRQQ